MPIAEAILLDTHAWIWLRAGDTAGFRRSSLEAITQAASRSALRVSIISVWELAMLAAKGRVQLGIPTAEWVKAALAAPGLSVADLTADIAIEACHLPGRFHSDPLDRMIVATARLTGATLYTKDQSILRYGRGGHVNASEL
ncbi:MAG: type II toxin-antitoxin system VapC family toxin [Burkholderiales bacterium]